jgi:hypothetical protein
VARINAKTGQENEETANHTWTATAKGRHRLLVKFPENKEEGT